MHFHRWFSQGQERLLNELPKSLIWRVSKQPKVADPGSVMPGIQAEGSG